MPKIECIQLKVVDTSGTTNVPAEAKSTGKNNQKTITSEKVSLHQLDAHVHLSFCFLHHPLFCHL